MVSDTMNEPRIQAAKEFTLQKFAATKKTANHSLEVFLLLKDEFHVQDGDILIAGMMMKLLEDTDTTPEEIETVASKRVSSLVGELSHAKEATKEEKNTFYQSLVNISPYAKMIKLADYLASLRWYYRIIRSGKLDQYPFVKDSKEYLTALRIFLDSCKERYPLETSTVYVAMYEVEKELKIVPDIEALS